MYRIKSIVNDIHLFSWSDVYAIWISNIYQRHALHIFNKKNFIFLVKHSNYKIMYFTPVKIFIPTNIYTCTFFKGYSHLFNATYVKQETLSLKKFWTPLFHSDLSLFYLWLTSLWTVHHRHTFYLQHKIDYYYSINGYLKLEFDYYHYISFR